MNIVPLPLALPGQSYTLLMFLKVCCQLSLCPWFCILYQVWEIWSRRNLLEGNRGLTIQGKAREPGLETVVLEAMTQEPRKSDEMDVSGRPEAAPETQIPVAVLCKGERSGGREAG